MSKFQKMRILISILTSSKPDLAKLCYESIANQYIPGFEYDIVVIVNSTNPNHIEDIKRIMPHYAHIHETESNGRPGKGHNSVLHYFKSKPEYNYCVIVDGDDFLYPRALNRLCYYLQYNPDVLFIAFHDILQLTQTDNFYISFRNKCYLSYHIEQSSADEWVKWKGSVNPFRNNINHMNTLARPFLFSRKSLEYDIYYDENMRLYDDFIVNLKCFEHSVLRNLNVYAMIDTNIYLYNSTLSDAATKRYFQEDNQEAQIEENFHYKNSIQNRFLAIKRWDLNQLPRLELGQTSQSDNFLTKCKFVDKLVSNMNMQCMVPRHDNIDITLQKCKDNGDMVLHDDLIQSLEWIYS